MSGAPLPVPQYINYTDNVLPYIGTDKIQVADNISTAIPPALADQLIAEGEALTLQDLSPYYVTVPNLVTTNSQAWTELPPYTYSTLYYMFVVQASLKLIGNFIARNTDDIGKTLSYFQRFYQSEYNSFLKRIMEKLPNGSYKYELIGLQPLNTGINRRPQIYARPGALGGKSYPDRQVTNPALNFSTLWPNGWQNGGQNN